MDGAAAVDAKNAPLCLKLNTSAFYATILTLPLVALRPRIQADLPQDSLRFATPEPHDRAVRFRTSRFACSRYRRRMPEAANAPDWPTICRRCLSGSPPHRNRLLFDSLADETGDTKSVRALNQ